MGKQLEGKVALVTGASSGIGAATVSALLNAGARVVASARRLDRLEELGRSLGVGNDRLLPLKADIRDEKDAEALVSKTLEWGGKLNILINNAGLSRGSLHEKMALDDLRLILDTNVFALANLTRVATPALKAAKGDIINISSTAAKALSPGSALYSATKAAVATFSEVIRKELSSDDVRVVTIYPGLVDTEFFDNFDDEKKANFAKIREAIHALQSEDLAEVITFAVTRPSHVSLNEIVIRPTRQVL